MVLALPDNEPNSSYSNWKSMSSCTECGTNFKYNLSADNDTWYEWKAAVEQPLVYTVNDIETTNAEKFSAFVLNVRLVVAATFDGGCFEN